jgi:hypothetical protein
MRSETLSLRTRAPLHLRSAISCDIAQVEKIGARDSVAALRTRDGCYATAP